MRYLVYALQSSGASLFTYVLSQKPNSIGIIDLYIDQLAPRYREFKDFDVFLKVTASIDFPLEDHILMFRPHKVICFDRDYAEIIQSLSNKFYANHGGPISKKIDIFDYYKKSFKFDYHFSYSEMKAKKTIPDLLEVDYYNFPRSLQDIVQYNNKCNWCRENVRKRWFLGNIHTSDGSNSYKSFSNLENVKINMEE